VAGAGAKHMGLVQLRTAFAQLRSNNNIREPQSRVAAFLAEQGKKLGSTLLASLAVKAGSDPFGKVRKMIKDMVTKLMTEANEEAEHKGFCDTEMATNKQTREQKATAAEELEASIEQMTAEAEQLAAQASDLNDQIAAVDSAVSEATSVRNDEKAKNRVTIADASQAKVAVTRALQVLDDFYNKAAGGPQAKPLPGGGPIAWDPRAIAILNLLQKGPGDDAPATLTKSFTGTGDAGGGIMGLLEVIVSDFERLETETSEAEASSQKDYQAFMADSAEDKAVKETDVHHKMKRRQRLESDSAAAKRDLRSTQDELHAALEYYNKLKPSCVAQVDTYAQRVAQRKEEIASLQEAVKILNGDDIA